MAVIRKYFPPPAVGVRVSHKPRTIDQACGIPPGTFARWCEDNRDPDRLPHEAAQATGKSPGQLAYEKYCEYQLHIPREQIRPLTWEELGQCLGDLQEQWEEIARASGVYAESLNKISSMERILTISQDALEQAKSGLIQLADRPVHWYVEKIDAALAALRRI